MCFRIIGRSGKCIYLIHFRCLQVRENGSEGSRQMLMPEHRGPQHWTLAFPKSIHLLLWLDFWNPQTMLFSFPLTGLSGVTRAKAEKSASVIHPVDLSLMSKPCQGWLTHARERQSFTFCQATKSCKGGEREAHIKNTLTWCILGSEQKLTTEKEEESEAVSAWQARGFLQPSSSHWAFNFCSCQLSFKANGFPSSTTGNIVAGVHSANPLCPSKLHLAFTALAFFFFSKGFPPRLSQSHNKWLASHPFHPPNAWEPWFFC